ncbi:hypothetical protein SAMN04487981_103426 [Streptomyces sp. cf386]|uniref:hypothetical protein n=1 Tax=Streptomyces sp. cf386 TaxID=1761904 RepID=UPI00088242B2|nr:hypothetical protein [Streptomyces sp. cf386]SDN06345.1 hypothetical protein SAMN04487981_103426 [Streptomyces sp. cf386]
MRVTTRATTRSTAARWGARCVGVGLATALAVAFAAGPASAAPGPQLGAAVAPEEVADNPDCDDFTQFAGAEEFDTDDEPTNGQVLDINGQGTITLGVTQRTEEPDGQLLSFDVEGPFAVVGAIVKGGPANEGGANLYDYTGTPAGQIEADVDLHAQLNPPGNAITDISHVAFCVVPDGNNT